MANNNYSRHQQFAGLLCIVIFQHLVGTTQPPRKERGDAGPSIMPNGNFNLWQI
jgi:hypothetical protein